MPKFARPSFAIVVGSGEDHPRAFQAELWGLLCEKEGLGLVRERKQRTVIAFKQLGLSTTDEEGESATLLDQELRVVEQFDVELPFPVVQKVLTCFDPSHCALLQDEALDAIGLETLINNAQTSLVNAALGDTTEPLDKIMSTLVEPDLNSDASADVAWATFRGKNKSKNRPTCYKSEQIFETSGNAVHPFVLPTNMHMSWSHTLENLSTEAAMLAKNVDKLVHFPSSFNVAHSGGDDLPKLVVSWHYPHSMIDDISLVGFQLFVREKGEDAEGNAHNWRAYSNKQEILVDNAGGMLESMHRGDVKSDSIIDKRSREATIAKLRTHGDNYKGYEVALFAVRSSGGVWRAQNTHGENMTWVKGDHVRVVKQGAIIGKTGVVTDPDWTGRVKIQMDNGQGCDGEIKSYMQESELVLEGSSKLQGMTVAHYGRKCDTIDNLLGSTLMHAHRTHVKGVSFTRFYTLLTHMSAMLFKKADVDRDGLVSFAETRYIFAEVLCADTNILEAIDRQIPPEHDGGVDAEITPLVFSIYTAAHLETSMFNYYEMFQEHHAHRDTGFPGFCNRTKKNYWFTTFVNLVIVVAAVNDALSTYPNMANETNEIEFVLLLIFTVEVIIGVFACGMSPPVNVLAFLLGTELRVADFFKLKWSEIVYHLKKHGHRGEVMEDDYDVDDDEECADRLLRKEELHKEKRRIQMLPLFRGEGYIGAWNCLDLFIVATGWMAQFTTSSGANFIRSLRLLRLARLAKSHKLVQAMIWGCFIGLQASVTIILVFIVLILLSAVLCVNFFGTRDPLHFYDIRSGILALYTMTTMDWVWVLDSTASSCDGNDHYRSKEQLWGTTVTKAFHLLGERARMANSTASDPTWLHNTDPIFQVAQATSALELSTVCVATDQPPTELVALAVFIFYAFTIAISLITMTLFVGSVSMSMLKVMHTFNEQDKVVRRHRRVEEFGRMMQSLKASHGNSTVSAFETNLDQRIEMALLPTHGPKGKSNLINAYLAGKLMAAAWAVSHFDGRGIPSGVKAFSFKLTESPSDSRFQRRGSILQDGSLGAYDLAEHTTPQRTRLVKNAKRSVLDFLNPRATKVSARRVIYDTAKYILIPNDFGGDRGMSSIFSSQWLQKRGPLKMIRGLYAALSAFCFAVMQHTLFDVIVYVAIACATYSAVLAAQNHLSVDEGYFKEKISGCIDPYETFCDVFRIDRTPMQDPGLVYRINLVAYICFRVEFLVKIIAEGTRPLNYFYVRGVRSSGIRTWK
jgi:hypothetical protein